VFGYSLPVCVSVLNFVGKVFPSQGDLHIAPFTDEALYMEQCGKANFWSVLGTVLMQQQ